MCGCFGTLDDENKSCGCNEGDEEAETEETMVK